MKRVFKLTCVVVAAIGIAAPAFAQSFDADFGTGKIVPFGVGSTSAAVQQGPTAGHKIRRDALAVRRSGLDAFAMVPASAGGSAFSPVVSGGGSIGYNENLRRDAW